VAVSCATSAATLLLKYPLLAQTPPLHGSARPDVAAIDHDRILAIADQSLSSKPTPLTTLPSPHSPGTPHDFYSEADSDPAAFTAHRDAILDLSRQVAALVAAFHLTHNERYAKQAVLHLRAWFIDPTTAMTPALSYGSMTPGNPKQRFEGILETVYLAEVAQSIPFLATSDSLPAEDLAALKAWFASYLQWLTTSRLAALARDQKDHHASSWLLQSAAYARLTGDEASLADLRHRFKTVTLRAQVVANGSFPHELTTPYPYRNSLFNLDLLAAACDLLSTRFESLWEFELQDGPGLHVVMARHFPFIQHRGSWPYKADLTHFDDLPIRNPSLLFAARAYTRPEYADLWKTLPSDTPVPELQRTFPIRQPLLWIARPRP